MIASFYFFSSKSAPKYLEQLRETGDPMVLTINGRAALVVMDTESYQDILDRLAYAEEIAAIRKGIEEFDRGQGRPARKALEELSSFLASPHHSGRDQREGTRRVSVDPKLGGSA